MYLLTCIQRTSSELESLAQKFETLEPRIAFKQTYPDELQGAFDSAEAAVRALLYGAQDQAFWLGLGVGTLRMPRFARALGTLATTDCSGDALDYSRVAVEQAQTGSPARGVVVLGPQNSFSQQATGLARLLYRVVANRTETENRVISLLVPGVRGQQKMEAQTLGISAQAVSKTLVRSLYHEQEAAIAALAEILLRLDCHSLPGTSSLAG